MMESAKKPKIFLEKIEILDEATGQIILKEQARLVYNENDSSDQLNRETIVIEDFDDNLTMAKCANNQEVLTKTPYNCEIDYTPNTTIQLFDEGDQTDTDSTCKKLPEILTCTSKKSLLNDYHPTNTPTPTVPTTVPNPIGQRMIIIESDHSDTNLFESLNNTQQYTNNASSSSGSKKTLTSSGLSAHIVQNYSILAHEITSPIDLPRNGLIGVESLSSSSSSSSSSSPLTKAASAKSSRSLKGHKSKNSMTSAAATYSSPRPSTGLSSPPSIPLTITPTTSSSCVDQNAANQSTTPSYRSMKDLATCQFCGRAMLKKNIPTHIRRAHTPKEELVCLNEEQNIFTFQHLKPGQRRKRSARAYDYSLMTATVSIDEDPSEGIENKFITEGEEILSTDLLQLADRIRYGVSQIPLDTLNKLVDILTKIEYNTQDEVSANAKSIKNMICYYLTSGEEFKYKIRQVGGDIVSKKRLVNELRNDLKEIMARKVQLERRIQPLVCELQKLEDQHLNLIESLLKVDELLQFDLISNDTNESAPS